MEDVLYLSEIHFAAGAHIEHPGTVVIPEGAFLAFAGVGTVAQSSITFTSGATDGFVFVEGGARLTLRDISLRIPPPATLPEDHAGDITAAPPAPQVGVFVRAGGRLVIEGTVETRFFTSRTWSPLHWPVPASRGINVGGGILDIDGIYNGSMRIYGGTANVNDGAVIGRTSSASDGNMALLVVSAGTMNVWPGASIEAGGGVVQDNLHIEIGPDAIFNAFGDMNRAVVVRGTFLLGEGALLGAAAPSNNPDNFFTRDATVEIRGRITRPAVFLGEFEIPVGARIENRVDVETDGRLTIFGYIQDLTVFEGGLATLEEGGHIHGMSNAVALDTQDDPDGRIGPAVFVMNGGLVDVSGNGEGTIHVGSGNGRFYMHGGTVQGPTAPSGSLVIGNAVTIASGSFFRMTGGEIVGAANRGVFNGHLAERAVFEMTGGTIRDNGSANVPGYPPHYLGGGGILLSSPSVTFTMTGGTISGNTAPNGGGIWASFPENVTIGSAAVFQDNVATQGLRVSDALATEHDQIAPGTVTYGSHAFNNHDINTELIPIQTITITGAGITGDTHTINLTGDPTPVPGGTQRVQLSHTIYPLNASLPAIEWVSTDMSVALVNNFFQPLGLLTGLSPGTVTITARSRMNPEIVSNAITVTVNGITVTGPGVTNNAITLSLGDTLQLSQVHNLSVLPPGDGSVAWQSSNIPFVTVDSDGLVRAVGVGTAQITVRWAASPTVVVSNTILVRVE